jgi:aspartyl-tRNA(Asn)/glutamyl-tRNA(Gln) amidotransferase subunit A
MSLAPASDAVWHAGRDAPLWAWTIAEASGAMRAGRLTPLELLEAHLARIEAVEPTIHAFIRLDGEGARDAAALAGREMAAGRWRGPLHGIPYAVKDNYDVAGLPATAGSRLRLDNVPDNDAGLVAALRGAGAICLGKLSTWEYGTGNGGEYFDLPFPPARNPWDTERYTGGSSTGAGAAVAAGLVKFALGSDTTGSVRLPAAATGTVGIIPTAGTLSLSGILPNCYSLDVPGTFAWTAADAAIVLSILLDDPDLATQPDAALAGLRVGVMRDLGPGFSPPDPELVQAFEAGLAVLASEGAILSPLTLPVPAAECFAVTRLIGPAETAAIHEAELRDRPDEIGFALRDKLLAGSLVRAVDYINAQRRRRDIADTMVRLMRGVDVLVTFGTLRLQPRLGVEPEMTAYTVETAMTPFNLSGHPALVQCTGFSMAGLPLHWQMAANHHGEAVLLRAAAAFEAATPWRERRPKPRPAPPHPIAALPTGDEDEAGEFAGFILRHGLQHLSPAHRARLAALADPVAENALQLPRPRTKADRPAAVFELPKHSDTNTSQ